MKPARSTPLRVASLWGKTDFRTIGLDLNEVKVDALNAGRSYVAGVATVEVLSAVEAGWLWATADAAVLADRDAVSICVPPPSPRPATRPAAGVVAV